MKNSKKAWQVFKTILILLFIFFLINYYQVESGNYQNELTQKTILTEEKIKEFEQDVKDGNYIDLKNYTENNYVDTSNAFSKFGNHIGEGLEKIINEKGQDFFKIIKKYFF